jgi:hypothetical protein
MTPHVVHATLYAQDMGGLTRDALQISWAARSRRTPPSPPWTVTAGPCLACVGASLITSSLPNLHFVTSSLHHFITSSLNHFITHIIDHFVTSSLRHFITSSLHHFVTSSLHHAVHHFITSSLHHFSTSEAPLRQ